MNMNAEGNDYDLLIERARELLPAIAARAEQTETHRRVPAETIAELTERKLFYMLMPRELGGLGASFETFSTITRLLATACGSTAWVFAVITETNWITALYPQEAVREVWSGGSMPLACASIVPFGRAEKVSGGWKIEGRWQYLSGSDHAQWAILSANAPGADGKDIVINLLVPRSQIEILDDWRVLGLAGTSTNSALVKGVFVPDHRCITHRSLLEGNAPSARAYSHYPLGWVPRQLVAAFSLSPVIVGLATRALELCTEGLFGGGKVPSTPDWPHVQAKYGEAVMCVETANEILSRYGTANEMLMRAGGPVTEFRGAQGKLAAAHMIRCAKHGIELIAEIGGSRWLFDSNPLQRVVRDALAAATHRSANWDLVTLAYGSALMNQKGTP